MTKSRGILGPRAQWTDEQLDLLRKFYPDFRSEDVATLVGHPLEAVYRKANSLGLKKSPECVAREAARNMDRIDHPAREHRFQKGHASWNKGTKGLVLGGVQTQFRPGQQPHNSLPIGSYRHDKDGTLQRKISNDKGSNSKRWRGVHELVWVEANGPLPAKHIVVFKPGMRTTVLEEITIDRVECISLAENMRRNTVHNMPKELAQLVQLRGALNRKINARMKQYGQ